MRAQIARKIAGRFRVVRPLEQGGSANPSDLPARGARLLVEDEALHRPLLLTVLPSDSNCIETLRLMWQQKRVEGCDPSEFPLCWGRSQGLFYYACPYEERLDLTQIGPLPWKTFYPTLLNTLRDLAQLHRHGLVHAGLSASRLSLHNTHAPVSQTSPEHRPSWDDLRSCALAGRPAPSSTRQLAPPDFSPPELVDPTQVIDRRSDLYALARIVSTYCEKIPKKFERLFSRLEQADPKNRPADAEEVLEALGASLELTQPTVVDSVPLSFADELRHLEGLLAGLESAEGGARALLLQGGNAHEARHLLAELKWLAESRVFVTELLSPHEGVVAALGRIAHDSSAARIAHRPEGESLTEVLRARQMAEEERRPAVFLVGDVSALSVETRKHVEMLLRTADEEDHILLILWSDSELEIGDGAVKVRALTTSEKQSQTPHAGKSPSDPASSRPLPELSESALLFLGTLASLEATIELDALPTLSLRESASLEQEQWFTRSGSRVRLSHPGAGQNILARLEPSLARRCHLHAVEFYATKLQQTPAPGTRLRATWVRHLLLAQEASAEHEFLRFASQEEAELWQEAARTISEGSCSPKALILATLILSEAGKSKEAVSTLETRRKEFKTTEEKRLAKLAMARCYLNQRRANAALDELSALLNSKETAQAEVLDLASRSHVLRGEYEEARSAARQALSLSPSATLAARLHDTLGVAESYLGHTSEAREHLKESSRLHSSKRALARSASYRALVEYRAGNISGAARGYLEGYRLANQCGATDLIFYSIQNAATASHQRGDLGRALSAYRQALDMARALNNHAASRSIQANLAKLYVDCGLFERAETAALQLLKNKDRSQDLLTLGSAHEVRADVARLTGRVPDALSAYSQATEAYLQQGLSRELLEVRLHEALCLSDIKKKAHAEEALNEARALGSSLNAPDLNARLLLAEAELLLQAGKNEHALTLLVETEKKVANLGLRALLGECHSRLSEAALRAGTDWQHENYRRQATEIWEQVAATLPEHLLDAYWAHPLRRKLRTASSRQHASSDQLEHLLSLNRKLSAQLPGDEFYELALASALFLTGAERGAIMLLERGQLQIVAGFSDDAFAISVGERAAAEQKPILIADASEDYRFLGELTRPHATLRSVLAVPILARSGAVGVIYVDHRMRSGVFRMNDAELLSGLCDQISIAQAHARLGARLETQERELKTQRIRIEALLHGRPQQEATDPLPSQLDRQDYGELVGRSVAMRKVFSTLDRVADTPVPILLSGESGTGKELIARAIHQRSRPTGPLVSINCGALPESLLEAELFGVRRGAFTGASEDRVGLLASASGGTVFLDELGEMPQPMQVKLLRALQEHEVTPVGGREPRRIDIRLLCATNRNLRTEVKEGRFREDLYYRVGVMEIDIPPLRERLEDLPALAEHLLARIFESTGAAKRLSPAALRRLLEFDFPGNVRQLENMLTKAALLSEGDVISPKDLPNERRDKASAASDRDEFQRREAQQMLTMLRNSRWNVSQAARSLGIPRASFYRKMERYGIGPGS